ncbi:MAG: chromate transporter [Elusimicrobiaceae bacterium]|nr:chromate transporter [Elusimicrobiaceae bacterium]
MIYIKLFFTFLKIGLFNFGGGYAMISFLQNEVVYKQAWLSTAEFTDIVAISQVTPGPVGINLATYTGYATSGSVWGAALATLAVCLPSFILLILAGKYVFSTRKKYPVVWRALRLVVIGLIASAALTLCNAENFIDYKSVLLGAAAFLAVWKLKRGPIFVLVMSGLLGFLLY